MKGRQSSLLQCPHVYYVVPSGDLWMKLMHPNCIRQEKGPQVKHSTSQTCECKHLQLWFSKSTPDYPGILGKR